MRKSVNFSRIFKYLVSFQGKYRSNSAICGVTEEKSHKKSTESNIFDYPFGQSQKHNVNPRNKVENAVKSNKNPTKIKVFLIPYKT